MASSSVTADIQSLESLFGRSATVQDKADVLRSFLDRKIKDDNEPGRLGTLLPGLQSDSNPLRGIDDEKMQRYIHDFVEKHGLEETYQDWAIEHAYLDANRPLLRLPCANVDPAKHLKCPENGTLACSECKLVSYCSKVS
jgi:hypothetical protein